MSLEKDGSLYDWAGRKGFPAEVCLPISDEIRSEIGKYVQLLSSDQFESIMHDDGIDMAFAEKVISFAIKMLESGMWKPDRAHEYFLNMLDQARDEKLMPCVRKDIQFYKRMIRFNSPERIAKDVELANANRQLAERAIKRLRSGSDVEEVRYFVDCELTRMGCKIIEISFDDNDSL